MLCRLFGKCRACLFPIDSDGGYSLASLDIRNLFEKCVDLQVSNAILSGMKNFPFNFPGLIFPSNILPRLLLVTMDCLAESVLSVIESVPSGNYSRRSPTRAIAC